MKQIQMVDLNTQYLRLKEGIDAALAQTMNHMLFINGPEVKEFQEDFEKYLGVKHVIPCANGTDALQLALMAFAIKPGDEVITSNFTFISTVEVIALLGLKPVVVDVNLENFNILPQEIEKKITPRTKAIIPVHLFGQAANMDAIVEIAQKYQLKIIEDVAQSIGGEYYGDGSSTKKLGTIGDVGCTSFFPSKNLGCFGDGGACFTNDDIVAQKLRELANHGSAKKYYHTSIGVNSRLDSMQAAILNVKLCHLDDFNKRRNVVAEYYDRHLADIEQLRIPHRSELSNHVFHQYTLRVVGGNRDVLQDVLLKAGIPSMIYYPLPIHKQEAFLSLVDGNEQFPNSDLLSEQVLSLPMHTEMDLDQLKYIVDTIKEFFK